MVSDEEIDRDRGILTPADRKYLIASEEYRQEEYSRQARHKREQEIKKRVENGLSDLELLFHHLDNDRLSDVFDGSPPALQYVVGFIYRVAGLGKISTAKDTFGSWVEAAIGQVIERENRDNITIRAPNITFEIEEPEVIDLEALSEKLEEGPGTLNQNELLFLLYLLHRDPKVVKGFEPAEALDAIAEHLDEEWGLRGQFVLSPDAYESNTDE